MNIGEGRFYAYVHQRIGSSAPFYIGKGKGSRALSFRNRNRHWRNIVAKDGGRDVVFLAKEIEEDFAFLIEFEAIDLFRRRGFTLANMTDGGEGTSGLKRPDAAIRSTGNSFSLGRKQSKEERLRRSIALRGRKLSAEHVSNLSAALRGKKASAETRLKQSLSHLGQGRPLSEETKAKLSEAHKGKTLSEKTKAKLSAANKGKRHSSETREKISTSNKGLKRSNETRARMVCAWKLRKLCR